MSVSRRVSSTCAGCLLAVLAIVLPVSAQTYTPRYTGSNARVTDFSNLPASAPRRFAVVGDVSQPGVYETSNRRLMAGAILKAAGSHASSGGYFTTHHSLRTTYTAIFDAETSEASHGDVIVVTASPRDRKAAPTNEIHVALIGLLPDPSVVRLPASERSLAALFSKLRQPAEVAAVATVNGGRSDEPLKNGDVIRVSSQLIDRSALAGCDGVLPVRSLDPQKAEPAATSAIDAVPEAGLLQYAELPALETPAVTQAPVDLAPATPQATVEAPKPTVADSEAVTEVTEPRQEPGKLEQVAGIHAFVRSDRSLSERISAAREGTDGPAAAADRDTSVRTLVVLLALGTLGLGVALLWLASERRLRAVSRPQAIPDPVAATAESAAVEDDLDRLIQGDLKIEDEPVVLPSRIALHGQAVGQKRLIVHPPQALAGPHFGAVQAEPTPAFAAKERQPVSTKPTAPPTPISSAVRSPKDTEGLLDRVLLAMQREGRR